MAVMKSLLGLRGVLPTGRFFRGSVAIAAGTGAAQLISVAAQPILTRVYSPSEYGVFSVAIAFLFVLGSITCLRYEYAIPLPDDDVAAANVFGLAMLLNIGLSLATAVGLWLFGSWLLALLGAPVLAPYVLLFAVTQFGIGINAALVNWAVRATDYSTIGVNRLTGAAVLAPVQIGLGFIGLGAPGLLLGAAAGTFAGSTRLARRAWHAHGPAFRGISWAGMLNEGQRYRRFPIFSSGSALIAALGTRAPLLLLVAFYGAAVGGQYFLAERLLYLPLTLVAGAVGQVFNAESARLIRGQQPRELRALFERTTWSLARMAIGPALLIAIAAPLVTAPVFGEDWRDAGWYIAILIPMFYLSFVTTATGNVLYVVERQPLQLVREITRVVLLGGSVLVAAILDLPPVTTIAVLSVAGCITYVLYGLISWWALANYRPRARRAETSAAADVPRVEW